MAKFARIDNSLPQRSDLVRLFHTLEREDLTLEDMEKIAAVSAKCRSAGPATAAPSLEKSNKQSRYRPLSLSA